MEPEQKPRFTATIEEQQLTDFGEIAYSGTAIESGDYDTVLGFLDAKIKPLCGRKGYRGCAYVYDRTAPVTTKAVFSEDGMSITCYTEGRAND